VLGLLMKELTWEERVVAAELEVVTICKLTMMLPEDTLRIVTWSALTPKVDRMKAMKASSKISVLLGLAEYQVKSVPEKFTANLEVSAWVADLKASFITKAIAGDQQLATALTFLGYEAKALMRAKNPANIAAFLTAMEEKFAAKATPWDNLQALLRLEYASPMQAYIEAFYRVSEKVELEQPVLAACFASKIESPAIRKALTEKKPATLADAVECVRQSFPPAASSSSSSPSHQRQQQPQPAQRRASQQPPPGPSTPPRSGGSSSDREPQRTRQQQPQQPQQRSPPPPPRRSPRNHGVNSVTEEKDEEYHPHSFNTDGAVRFSRRLDIR